VRAERWTGTRRGRELPLAFALCQSLIAKLKTAEDDHDRDARKLHPSVNAKFNHEYLLPNSVRPRLSGYPKRHLTAIPKNRKYRIDGRKDLEPRFGQEVQSWQGAAKDSLNICVRSPKALVQ
jgi:hypothetical protein